MSCLDFACSDSDDHRVRIGSVRCGVRSCLALSVTTFALVFANACGEDSPSGENTDSTADAGETSPSADEAVSDDADTTEEEDGDARGIACAATFDTRSDSVEVTQDGGTSYVDLASMMGICQQTTLLHPIDGSSLDSSCDWLTGLSSEGLFNGNGFEGVDVRARTCETQNCVKRCLKLVRPSEQGSVTILDQNTFDVTVTLYEESDLETFTLWCQELRPAGELLDCN